MDDHSGIRCQAFVYREDQNVYTAGVCDSHVLGTRETVLPTLTRGSHLKYALDHYHKPSLHTQYPYMNLSLPPILLLLHSSSQPSAIRTRTRTRIRLYIQP